MNYPSLFEPIKIGELVLLNRIFMAPMTRLRSKEPGDVPVPIMADYYAQRAKAGLIISEATQVSFEAKGYAGAPGLHTGEQISAWKRVNAAIHRHGGKSAVQLWHTGRISHNSVQPGKLPPVAPSAINAGSRITLRDAQGQPYREETSTPRALAKAEILRIISDFGEAAENAPAAGFDLVEIHGAHGYLIHQFLSPVSNVRTDEYGGNIINRSRFALEIIDNVIRGVSRTRVGFRIFPLGASNGVDGGEDQEEAALYLIGELAKRKIAYLHISEPDWLGGKSFSDAFRSRIRKAFPGPIVAAGSYTPEKADRLIRAGLIDAVAFGRLFISNPDLVERIRRDAPFNERKAETVYGGGAEGYTDYPFLTADS